MISITTSKTSLSHDLSPPTISTTTIATLSDKVKQLHGVKVTRRSYNNKETTIRLLPVAVLIDMQVVKIRNMIIAYIITNHILAIPYHNPYKNKLDALYFVDAIFTWLLWVMR